MLFSYYSRLPVYKNEVDSSIFYPQLSCFFVSEMILIYDVALSNAIFFVTSGGTYVKNDTIRFLSKTVLSKHLFCTLGLV